ncbi:hypothetical protein [Sulfurimonas sp.]|uniref:hypothetical protein n=1 Tax=Sulfurimonas sp. TaxID=2022749 RepID=UPI0025CCBF93|nr:hypothetical protein [Sulfurimonas sp.]
MQLDKFVSNGFQRLNQYSPPRPDDIAIFVFNIVGLVVVLLLPRALKMIITSIKNRKQIAQWIRNN